jgi:hypothetical protein
VQHLKSPPSVQLQPVLLELDGLLANRYLETTRNLTAAMDLAAQLLWAVADCRVAEPA